MIDTDIIAARMWKNCGKIVEKGMGKNLGHYECVPVRFFIARNSIFSLI